MRILSYVLIIFIISCAPTEDTPPPDQTQTTSTPDTLQTNTSKPEKNVPDASENSLKESDETLAPTVNSAEPQNQEPIMPVAPQYHPTEIQFILSQLHGLYEFDLDVHQKWWTIFERDKPVRMILTQNPRPNTEQLLIDVSSNSNEIIGKFCVVQSHFELQGHVLSAHNSIANEGGIADINNVKNTITINNDEPIGLAMRFYGDHGSELKIFKSKTRENTRDFDSLCRSCGFEIREDGLCGRKSIPPRDSL